MWVETFTGLRMGQFEGLLRVVRERGGNGPGGGRPWCLPLAARVLLVAVYYASTRPCDSSRRCSPSRRRRCAGSSSGCGPLARCSSRTQSTPLLRSLIDGERVGRGSPVRRPDLILAAPAACWLARTIVESTETARLRSLSASAWAVSAVKRSTRTMRHERSSSSGVLPNRDPSRHVMCHLRLGRRGARGSGWGCGVRHPRVVG